MTRTRPSKDRLIQSREDDIYTLKKVIMLLLLRDEGKLPFTLDPLPYNSMTFGMFGGCRHDEVLANLKSWAHAMQRHWIEVGGE